MLDIHLGERGEIVLKGRFDASQAERAGKFMDAVAEPRIVDFKELEYISSAGLGVLLKTQKRLMAAGKGLLFVNVSKHIYDILHYSGFDEIFEIQPPAGSV